MRFSAHFPSEGIPWNEDATSSKTLGGMFNFGGNNLWWIIILILLFGCGCGNNGCGTNTCGCGTNTCGCGNNTCGGSTCGCGCGCG